MSEFKRTQGLYSITYRPPSGNSYTTFKDTAFRIDNAGDADWFREKAKKGSFVELAVAKRVPSMFEKAKERGEK